MLLAIDVGNTNITLGLFEGNTLKHHWRVSTDREKTSDEFGILFMSLFQYAGEDIHLSGMLLFALLPRQSCIR